MRKTSKNHNARPDPVDELIPLYKQKLNVSHQKNDTARDCENITILDFLQKTNKKPKLGSASPEIDSNKSNST